MSTRAFGELVGILTVVRGQSSLCVVCALALALAALVVVLGFVDVLLAVLLGRRKRQPTASAA